MRPFWNATSGDLIGRSFEHSGSSSVAFSLDDKFVVTGGTDRTARLWEARTEAQASRSFSRPGVCTSVAFSPDGTTILVGTMWSGRQAISWTPLRARWWANPSCTLRIRRTCDACDIEWYPKWDISVRGATAPMARKLVTGCDDHTARCWRLPRVGLSVDRFDTMGRSDRWRSAPTTSSSSPAPTTGPPNSGLRRPESQPDSRFVIPRPFMPWPLAPDGTPPSSPESDRVTFGSGTLVRASCSACRLLDTHSHWRSASMAPSHALAQVALIDQAVFSSTGIDRRCYAFRPDIYRF